MIVTSEFRPSWWLRNPHLQTLLSGKLILPPLPPLFHQRLELPDGDFIDIALSEGFQASATQPIVAMFHGLAGCYASSYVRGAFATLTDAGFRVALMHWRGCSGEPNRLRTSYHSGASSDVAWFGNWLASHWPQASLQALGFSLGANALIKHLGEARGDTPFAHALAVCPPMELAIGADKMNRGFSRVYQHHLVGLMRQQYLAKRKRYPQLGLPAIDASVNTFWRFDDAVTAPLHGFANARDYYRRTSCRQFLPAVTVPLHIVCARDDPFFTEAVLPEASELANQTRLEISDFGGHIGFLESLSQQGRWLDRHIATLVDQRE